MEMLEIVLQYPVKLNTPYKIKGKNKNNAEVYNTIYLNEVLLLYVFHFEWPLILHYHSVHKANEIPNGYQSM